MPDYDQAEQTQLTEPDKLEQYLITGQQVVQLLRHMAEKTTIITAYFDGGRHFMLSAVVGVLQDRNLVVLDIGPDEATTQRALNAGRLLCTARIDGVTVRFSLEGLSSAKYQGHQSIAAPLPQSAYRFQRREFYRATTPTVVPATCRIPLGEGEPATLIIADISCGGVGVIDKEGRLTTEVMAEHAGALLSLPDFGELRVDLQVRSHSSHIQRNNERVQRYGMQFLRLSMSDNVFLQRYVTKLQMLNKGHD